ncbi:hypothetical protein EAG_01348, partial [Camponotus floridanus]
QVRDVFIFYTVTGDEKWIYFNNPKRRKSICDPGKSSTPKQNIHGKMCVMYLYFIH